MAESTRDGTWIGIIHNTEIYADGLATSLQSHGHRTCVNPTDLFDWLDAHPNALIICHVDEPVVPDLLRRLPDLRLVAVIDGPDPAEYQRAFAHGATGVFPTTTSASQALTIITAALDGHARLPHQVIRHMATSAATPTPNGLWLSDTETTILNALAHGDTIATIANKIGYSERTTHTVLNRLYKRIGAANRAEAITLATRWNITN